MYQSDSQWRDILPQCISSYGPLAHAHVVDGLALGVLDTLLSLQKQTHNQNGDVGNGIDSSVVDALLPSRDVLLATSQWASTTHPQNTPTNNLAAALMAEIKLTGLVEYAAQNCLTKTGNTGASSSSSPPHHPASFPPALSNFLNMCTSVNEGLREEFWREGGSKRNNNVVGSDSGSTPSPVTPTTAPATASLGGGGGGCSEKKSYEVAVLAEKLHGLIQRHIVDVAPLSTSSSSSPLSGSKRERSPTQSSVDGVDNSIHRQRRVVIVDVGAGQGYLSAALCLPPYNYTVVAVEREAVQVHGSMRRSAVINSILDAQRKNRGGGASSAVLPSDTTPASAEKAEVDGVNDHDKDQGVQNHTITAKSGQLHVLPLDITSTTTPMDVANSVRKCLTDEEENGDDDIDIVLTSLHACGSLSNHMLRIFTDFQQQQSEIKVKSSLGGGVRCPLLVNVGCCYNLIDESVEEQEMLARGVEQFEELRWDPPSASASYTVVTEATSPQQPPAPTQPSDKEYNPRRTNTYTTDMAGSSASPSSIGLSFPCSKLIPQLLQQQHQHKFYYPLIGRDGNMIPSSNNNINIGGSPSESPPRPFQLLHHQGEGEGDHDDSCCCPRHNSFSKFVSTRTQRMAACQTIRRWTTTTTSNNNVINGGGEEDVSSSSLGLSLMSSSPSVNNPSSLSAALESCADALNNFELNYQRAVLQEVYGLGFALLTGGGSGDGGGSGRKPLRDVGITGKAAPRGIHLTIGGGDGSAEIASSSLVLFRQAENVVVSGSGAGTTPSESSNAAPTLTRKQRRGPQQNKKGFVMAPTTTTNPEVLDAASNANIIASTSSSTPTITTTIITKAKLSPAQVQSVHTIAYRQLLLGSHNTNTTNDTDVGDSTDVDEMAIMLVRDGIFTNGFVVPSFELVRKKLYGLYPPHPTSGGGVEVVGDGVVVDDKFADNAALTQCARDRYDANLTTTTTSSSSLKSDTDAVIINTTTTTTTTLPSNRVLLSTLWTLRAILGSVVLEDLILADRVAALREQLSGISRGGGDAWAEQIFDPSISPRGSAVIAVSLLQSPTL